ncbi:hypothetical protein EMIT079MI2_420023 [Bacillus sp. IT-79MI2]
MKITNTKFAHEIIDLLINHYVENELTTEQKMKFKLLTEIKKEVSLFLIGDTSFFIIYPSSK